MRAAIHTWQVFMHMSNCFGLQSSITLPSASGCLTIKQQLMHIITGAHSFPMSLQYMTPSQLSLLTPSKVHNLDAL
jgi:hypothetical protein